MYADRLVSFLRLTSVKECLCLVYLSLNSRSERPMYVLVDFPGAVTEALYMIHFVKHFPSKGQMIGPPFVSGLQLHVRLAASGSLRTLTLWELIIAPMEGMQL